MSAVLKENFETSACLSDGDGGGGGGPGGPKKGFCVLLPNEDVETLERYILKSIKDSADILKRRMTAHENLDHIIRFSVMTENAGMVGFSVSCTDTLQTGMRSFKKAIHKKLFQIYNGRPILEI